MKALSLTQSHSCDGGFNEILVRRIIEDKLISSVYNNYIEGARRRDAITTASVTNCLTVFFHHSIYHCRV